MFPKGIDYQDCNQLLNNFCSMTMCRRPYPIGAGGVVDDICPPCFSDHLPGPELDWYEDPALRDEVLVEIESRLARLKVHAPLLQIFSRTPRGRKAEKAAAEEEGPEEDTRMGLNFPLSLCGSATQQAPNRFCQAPNRFCECFAHESTR